MFSEGFEPVCVTRPSCRIVPWPVAPLLQRVPGPAPRPEFDEGVQPQAQGPTGHVAPHVANLLLAGTKNFLHLMKVLFELLLVVSGGDWVGDQVSVHGQERGTVPILFGTLFAPAA